jgi:hypothetical protein
MPVPCTSASSSRAARFSCIVSSGRRSPALSPRQPIMSDSAEEWPRRMTSDHDVQKWPRLHAGSLVASGHARHCQERAARLGVHRHLVAAGCGVCPRVAVASVRGSRLAAAYSPALPPLERLGRDHKTRFTDHRIKTLDGGSETVGPRLPSYAWAALPAWTGFAYLVQAMIKALAPVHGSLARDRLGVRVRSPCRCGLLTVADLVSILS